MEGECNLTIEPQRATGGGWYISVANSNGGYGMPISNSQYEELKKHFAEYYCNKIKEELLKQLMPVVYENGYPIKAVPQTIILSIDKLI